MNSESLIFLGILYLVISVVILIVFFQMASNVKSIKNLLLAKHENNSFQSAIDRAKFAEFKGKPEEAIDEYKTALFYAKNYKPQNKRVAEAQDQFLKNIKDQIIKLGGTLPGNQ